MSDRSRYDLPRWILAIGPVFVLLAVCSLLYLTSPFGDLSGGSDATTLEVLWIVTVIGILAGIVPVAIGMLWFPFIRNLETRYVHGFMTLAAGVLVFIGLEIVRDVVELTGAVGASALAAGIAVGSGGLTFGVMYVASRWRQRTMVTGGKSGVEIAYLVAIALGLHSIGEGLGIGVSYVQGDTATLTLLVLAFVMHNVMEGPTVVAAVARERATPPLRHFAAMGVIAGGPVILGGWIGSFAQSDLLAILCYAIAVGAIVQVLIEVGQLIRIDAEAVLTRTNAASFAVGFALMFLLEDVLTEAILDGWLLTG
ncbi:ZIP family metal transporter [Halopiger goleimassiliensis]|uniref:ZIP family metal transporter n=1 Tax=Halopiger goleimassiliensis TaxID=1293048 RepID=UPI000677A86E|nr:metal cation transporter [Halopiger goleimassiliensis]